MKHIALTAIRLLSRIPGVFPFSRKVVDFVRNENNCEPDSNGEMAFITRNASRFSTIFDVGANIGEWTTEVSRLCPDAQIYSFEPVTKIFEHVAKLESERVHPFNFGFGEAASTQQIQISESDSTLNSVYSRESVSYDRTEDIQIRTVDEFCKEHNIERISFLKIDTEGNELNVLKGARGMIANKNVDTIQIEYGGTYINARILLKDIFEYFEGTGYSLYKVFSDRIEKVSYEQGLENFQYANYIAILDSYDHR